MDDKELIAKVKNSFRAKKSRAEVLQGFQKRGYKLAYADALMKKANRPKKIAITLLVTIIVFLSLTFSAYTVFSTNQKIQLTNPLTGFTITGNTVASTSATQQATYTDIEITPDFISFLLNEIGAWQLHKNPLTFEKPIINFKVGDKKFHSEIGNEIKTHVGFSEAADLQFNTNKQDVINAIMSNNPKEAIEKSVKEGTIQIETIAGETELFAKGYLKLYDSLK